MYLRVADVLSNKVISLEVEGDVTLGELLEAVIKKFKLPEDYMYSVIFGSKELGPDKYDYTLTEIGIRDGDEIQIVGRPQGGTLIP